MERNDILKRSRNENHDEGMAYMQSLAQHKGIRNMLIMNLLIVLYNYFAHHQPSYSACLLFCAYTSTEAFHMYKLNHKKKTLVWLLILLFLTINCLYYVLVRGY